VDEATRCRVLGLARSNGVVGAGGAGFPAYAKLSARVDTVIANGAECEPLLGSDQAMVEARLPELLDGLRLAMELTGAARGIVAVKAKHASLCAMIESALSSTEGRGLSLLRLGNYYPAGDEVILVHAATGLSVPGGGLPKDVGVVVQNVTTLVNLAAASRGIPVTARYVTVAGAVARPATFLAPVGTPFADLLAAAGGATTPSPRILVGGPMMGRLGDLASGFVTKTVGGLIVLPDDHKLVAAKSRDPKRDFAKARAVCCQCNYCTELCPRYLVGHELRPHRLVRTMPGADLSDGGLDSAFLCSECGLCGAFACVQEIMPVAVNAYLKRELRAAGRKPVSWGQTRPRSGMEDRRVPTERLMARIDVARFGPPPGADGEAGGFPVSEEPLRPREVSIALSQHIGAPCAPTVRVGDEVEAGAVVGTAPEGTLGADVHASIRGRVVRVGDGITIRAEA